MKLTLAVILVIAAIAAIFAAGYLAAIHGATL